LSWRASSGASVATIMMIEPCSAFIANVADDAAFATLAALAARSASIRPSGVPSTVSIGSRPKFASTSAPTV
jgi:hypothetical protein